MNTVLHGWRFTRGALRLLRAKPVSVQEALAQLEDEFRRRDKRFLQVLDELIWPNHRNPYRALFAHAGMGPNDVRHLVGTYGVEGALETLRDEGVYVSYEEWQGLEPARRGSATFRFKPLDFFNPRLKPEYSTGTGGTRSGGIPLASSFESRRDNRASMLIRLHLWGVVDAPVAIWRPALPGGGLSSVLNVTSTLGRPPERWFSQIPPVVGDVALRKKMANVLFPLVGRLAGVRLPRPAEQGRALLHVYASSGAALARHAFESGTPLDGLLIRTVGEPLTSAKAAIMHASGAGAAAIYGFNQHGPAAYSCPLRESEDLHLLEHEVAVIGRPRTGPDGAEVRALLWTSIAMDSRSVLINVENDDYGDLYMDQDACGCMLGSMGWRRRVLRVRGLSKVVAGGVSVLGEVFERLAEDVLPERFGGGPADYQFVEEESGAGTRVTLRIGPRIGEVDEEAVRSTVRGELRSTEPGLLADAVWGASDSPRIVRADPLQTSAGKILPFETLRPG